MAWAFLNSDATKVCLWLITANCAVSANLPCMQLQGAKPRQQLAYLKADRAKLDPPCIVYAIEQLGLHYHVLPYRPSSEVQGAAAILATYLDFQSPGTEKIGKRVSGSRIYWLGEKYPAATALFEIGLQST